MKESSVRIPLETYRNLWHSMEASFTRTPGVPCNEPSWIPLGTIRKVWHSMEASFTWTSGVPCDEPFDSLRNP